MQLDEASASDQYNVLTFDLQKALPFSKLIMSVAYYKIYM